MHFKTKRVEREFMDAPPALLLLVAEFENYSRAFGVDPVMTRAWEDTPGQTSLVHKYKRAVDFRCDFGGKSLYTEQQRNAIAVLMNTKWERTDKRPTLLWHASKEGLVHGHLQLAQNATYYINKEHLLCLKQKN